MFAKSASCFWCLNLLKREKEREDVCKNKYKKNSATAPSHTEIAISQTFNDWQKRYVFVKIIVCYSLIRIVFLCVYPFIIESVLYPTMFFSSSNSNCTIESELGKAGLITQVLSDIGFVEENRRVHFALTALQRGLGSDAKA